MRAGRHASASVIDYLTVDGRKLSKSAGHAYDPVTTAARFGVDALRWWFLRDVPRAGDSDFREELLVLRANELADGLGNLVNRTITLIARYRRQGVGAEQPRSPEARALHALINETPGQIDKALARFDFRAAATSLWCLVDEGNRFVAVTRPWELAGAEESGEAGAATALDEVLSALLLACHLLARELQPFLPAASVRLAHALAETDPQLGRRLFAKAAPRT